MSTVALRCPYCDSWLRVAVQPATIVKLKSQASEQLLVTFDTQSVAHICKKKEE